MMVPTERQGRETKMCERRMTGNVDVSYFSEGPGLGWVGEKEPRIKNFSHIKSL